jgi:hypothetical protein
MDEGRVGSVAGSQQLGRYRSQAVSPYRRKEHSLWELPLEVRKAFDQDHEPLARPLVGCPNEPAETAVRGTRSREGGAPDEVRQFPVRVESLLERTPELGVMDNEESRSRNCRTEARQPSETSHG